MEPIFDGILLTDGRVYDPGGIGVPAGGGGRVVTGGGGITTTNTTFFNTTGVRGVGRGAGVVGTGGGGITYNNLGGRPDMGGPNDVQDVLPPVGCTDPFAANYQPNAVIDDGSCRYVNPDGTTGEDGGETPPKPVGTLGIKFTGEKDAEVVINGQPQGYTIPDIRDFDYKEFSTEKEITVRKTGLSNPTKYRIFSDVLRNEIGAQVVVYVVTKEEIPGRWVGYTTINASGPTTGLILPFSFVEKNDPVEDDTTDTGGGGTPLPPPPRDDFMTNITQVTIKGDVSNENVIKYITDSSFNSGFVGNGTVMFNIVPDLSTNTAGWIEFQRVGINNTTHKVTYEVTYDGVSRIYENDFRKECDPQGFHSLDIKVTVTKLTELPSPSAPTINIRPVSLEYNIESGENLIINYDATNADKVVWTMGNIVRELSPNATVSLKSSDFSNGLGNYTLYAQPVSNTLGSGEYDQVKINVVSKTYREGPDITNINYPSNIKGADFKGFDENFTISWQSINTNFVQIYAGVVGNQYVLAKSSANGSLSLNVANVLKKANLTFNDSTKAVSFTLILVPHNTEGDSEILGKEEKIKIVFDKSTIKLNRAQVVEDLLSAFKKSCDRNIFKKYTGSYLTHFAHFGNGDNKLITTWASDAETFSEYEEQPDGTIRKVKEEKAAVLKLYEPLPTSVQLNQKLWISKVQSLTLFEQITITENQVIDCIPLYPNMSLDLGEEIGFQILNDLIASGSKTSAQIVEEYVNKNELSTVKLNIEYVTGSDYYWENFVKYSNAEERINNFFYKVKAIEFYENKLSSLETASLATSNAITIQNEQNRISGSVVELKKGFDAFEYFLYTESSPISYPGAGGSSVSSSVSDVAQDWLQDALYSARIFDKNNVHSIQNNIPVHFIQDSNNDEYILFLNMIGNHFDVIWSYVNGLRDSKKILHTDKGGMVSDLLYHMLESFGWSERDMGIDSKPLWEYVYGIYKDGTVISEIPGKKRQQEVWRRLLNNLPFLYKTKGTRRSIQAIMACYGVPTSMMSIMEFGGPSEPSDSGLIDTDRTEKFTYDDRTAAVNFDGSSCILVPWTGSSVDEYPATIEMRINTEEVREHTLISGSGMLVKIIPSGSRGKPKCKLHMESNGYSGSTEYIPFFNDLYTHVAITRKKSGENWVFDLHMKETLNDRVRNKASGHVYIPTSSLSWATSQDKLRIGEGFQGKMDEFRLWKSALSESRIENHAFLPDGIDGNDVYASTDDLLLRFDFEYPKNLGGGTAYLPNVALNRTYYVSSSVADGTILNFTSNTTYPYQYTPYERTVTATVPSTGIGLRNKVRFKNRGIDSYLSDKVMVSNPNIDEVQDSNRLGLFFSPIKEINMDIVKSFGNFNIDDYIGNPADYYEDKYESLDRLRNYYFKRYNLNIYEYIQLFRYINKSLFSTLESICAGRTNVATGLLIEPHLLERNKIKRKKPTAENIGTELKIDVTDISVSHQMDNYLSVIDASSEVNLAGQNLSYNGGIDATNFASLNAFYNVQETIIDTQEQLNVIGFYKTYFATVDAEIKGTLTGEYAGSIFTRVGIDPDAIANAGFGLYTENGHTIRTYIDKYGNYVRDRKQVYVIKEERIINVPVDNNPLDPSLGSTLTPTSFYDYKVTFLDVGSSAPAVTGSIVEVSAVDGYLPSHYRYVGDLPTGLQNSWFLGSVQTADTTLDGGSPVQTFATNPNTLLVNATGRGSGEPILYVD